MINQELTAIGCQAPDGYGREMGCAFQKRMVGGVTDVVAGVPSVLLQDGYVALQDVLGAE